MRILLVAPETGLPAAAAEVQAIVNTDGLDVRLLQGSVTERDVIAAIRDGRFDVLWLATHGNSSGVLLSGHVLLETPALTALVRSHRVPFVFLNTCESVQVAMQISQETGADIVATVLNQENGALPDATAYRTGALLAWHLGRGASTREAYEASKPGGNRTYVYLAGTQATTRSQHDTQQPIEQRVSRLERDVHWLKQALYPGPRKALSRVLFYGLLIVAWSLWMVGETRAWLLTHPAQAIVITVLLGVSALIIRWLPEEAGHD